MLHTSVSEGRPRARATAAVAGRRRDGHTAAVCGACQARSLDTTVTTGSASPVENRHPMRPVRVLDERRRPPESPGPLTRRAARGLHDAKRRAQLPLSFRDRPERSEDPRWSSLAPLFALPEGGSKTLQQADVKKPASPLGSRAWKWQRSGRATDALGHCLFTARLATGRATVPLARALSALAGRRCGWRS